MASQPEKRAGKEAVCGTRLRRDSTCGHVDNSLEGLHKRVGSLREKGELKASGE